ncbi:MAG: hypothetical protein JXD22_15670 [Sedimentisphaerales bacterium]|nr:hypothetical protein [Sedimentisphaerales bacterium]
MNDKKNRWLILLLCINVLLITAIVISHVGIPNAYGQVRPYDYMLIPGRMRSDTEVVWVVDLGTEQMTSCIFNKRTGQIEIGQVVDLIGKVPF